MSNPLGVWSDKLQSYVFGVIHQDTLRAVQRTGRTHDVSFEPQWPSMPPYALAIHRGLPMGKTAEVTKAREHVCVDFTFLKEWHNAACAYRYRHMLANQCFAVEEI